MFEKTQIFLRNINIMLVYGTYELIKHISFIHYYKKKIT